MTVVAFTVTGDVPIEVNVNDCVVDLLTITFPKLRLLTLTVSSGVGAATPVPLSVTSAVLSVDELLLIVNFPLTEPVDAGLNCTCSVNDCVGARVTGKVSPTTAKPAPMTAAELTVTGSVPVDVSVNDCIVDVFTETFPKLKLPVLTASCGLATSIPIPRSEIVVGLPVDEVLRISSCPLNIPIDVGLKSTCRVNDCFGANVIGKTLPPERENPAPEIAAALIATGIVPVDVSVSGCVVDVFTETFPKLRLPALTVN